MRGEKACLIAKEILMGKESLHHWKDVSLTDDSYDRNRNHKRRKGQL